MKLRSLLTRKRDAKTAEARKRIEAALDGPNGYADLEEGK